MVYQIQINIQWIFQLIQSECFFNIVIAILNHIIFAPLINLLS
jgi:hypothetical protein